jgi:hypothetical protein
MFGLISKIPLYFIVSSILHLVASVWAVIALVKYIQKEK